MEEMEERVAKLVCEPGRTILQAVYAHLDQKLMRKREKGLRNMGILPACFSGNGAGTCIRWRRARTVRRCPASKANPGRRGTQGCSWEDMP